MSPHEELILGWLTCETPTWLSSTLRTLADFAKNARFHQRLQYIVRERSKRIRKLEDFIVMGPTGKRSSDTHHAYTVQQYLLLSH